MKSRDRSIPVSTYTRRSLGGTCDRCINIEKQAATYWAASQTSKTLHVKEHAKYVVQERQENRLNSTTFDHSVWEECLLVQ